MWSWMDGIVFKIKQDGKYIKQVHLFDNRAKEKMGKKKCWECGYQKMNQLHFG